MAHVDLTGSPSQHGTALLKAVGGRSYEPAGPQLGSPGSLTSARRQQVIALRDALSGPGR